MSETGPATVRIPADVEREDRLVANLTARQLVILAGTALVLYSGWMLTRTLLPLAIYLVLAIPVGLAVTVLALGQRDGLSLDRLALAALRQHLSPRVRVAAPEGMPPVPEWVTQQLIPKDRASGAQQPHATRQASAGIGLPARGVTEAGVVDLGSDGLALVAAASTVPFSLRTPGEQEALVAAFGRYLHSLTAPVQILIRVERLDVSEQITELREAAPGLAHPALQAAAREHADYLDQLRSSANLLRRQVLLIFREPTASAHGEHTSQRSAETRLAQQVQEARELVAAAGITVTPLAPGQATAVLAAACNPDSLVPAHADLAGAEDVITTPAEAGR